MSLASPWPWLRESIPLWIVINSWISDTGNSREHECYWLALGLVSQGEGRALPDKGRMLPKVKHTRVGERKTAPARISEDWQGVIWEQIVEGSKYEATKLDTWFYTKRWVKKWSKSNINVFQKIQICQYERKKAEVFPPIIPLFYTSNIITVSSLGTSVRLLKIHESRTAL